MKVSRFIAETPGDALRRIHEQFGPEAVVFGVRQLPTQGLARLWRKQGMVEVLAGILPHQTAGSPDPTLVDQNPLFNRQSFQECRSSAPTPPLRDGTSRPHVFIGPPGTGKSSLLCKWLVSSLLAENLTVQVWRLDGINPNSADFLNVYAEMFGFNVQRFWARSDLGSIPAGSHAADDASTLTPRKELRLIDLPGVDTTDPASIADLEQQLLGLGSPRIHLVLNAAYDASILTDQALAFARFEPEDLSFTHLDEERRPEKLLSVASGTNCCLRFLGAGQKIPGEFFIVESTQPLSQEAA